jgi:hypothetical protein
LALVALAVPERVGLVAIQLLPVQRQLQVEPAVVMQMVGQAVLVQRVKALIMAVQPARTVALVVQAKSRLSIGVTNAICNY